MGTRAAQIRGEKGDQGEPGAAGAQGPQGTLPGLVASSVTATSTDASSALVYSTAVPLQGAARVRIEFTVVRDNGLASYAGELWASFRNPAGTAILNGTVIGGVSAGNGTAEYGGAWLTLPPNQRPRFEFAVSGNSAVVNRIGRTGESITWEITTTAKPCVAGI